MARAATAVAPSRAERARAPPRFRIVRQSTSVACCRWWHRRGRRSAIRADISADTHRLRSSSPLVAPAPSASTRRSSVLEAAVLAIVSSATLLGARGRPVRVEVHVANGLPGFTIVGLPDEACRESRDRVRAALLSSGLPWPQKRVTVNLAPSAHAQGRRRARPAHRRRRAGRLGGRARRLDRGPRLPRRARPRRLGPAGAGHGAARRRARRCVPRSVPPSCVHEASLTASGSGARRSGRWPSWWPRCAGEAPWPALPPPRSSRRLRRPRPTWPRCAASRWPAWPSRSPPPAAITCSCWGRPGRARRCWRRACPRLLPPLEPAAALEVTMIHSAAGVALPPGGLVTRAAAAGAAPHGLAGGDGRRRHGRPPAGRSVAWRTAACLLLDELAEFQPAVLDGLRQPLEEGVIRVIRAKAAVEFPSRFLLVGTMNPCPCGAAEPAACTCGDGCSARATSDGCRGRCSTASTSGSASAARRSRSCWAGPSRRRARRSPARVAAARAAGRRAGRVPQRRHARRTGSTSVAPPQRRRPSRLLRRELETNRLTGPRPAPGSAGRPARSATSEAGSAPTSWRTSSSPRRWRSASIPTSLVRVAA